MNNHPQTRQYFEQIDADLLREMNHRRDTRKDNIVSLQSVNYEPFECAPFPTDLWEIQRINGKGLYASREHRKFGVDQSMYASMMIAQDGKCAVCNGIDNKALAVDHCHTEGHVRGLLCSRCNMTLGSVNDNIATLQAMIDYLSTPRR